MIQVQKWLEENYPNKNETIHIDAKNSNLERELIIKDFPNLERIECGGNKNLTSIELDRLPKLNYFHANNCQLTDIKINNCSEISYLNVGNNLLRDIGFLNNLSTEQLNIISVHTNNFKKQGLESFSKFDNLKELYLDNCDREKFRKHIYNRFAGSLKPLQKLTKLEILSIGNTDINSGLEHLPDNFRKIGFNVAWQINTGCAKIRRELEEIVQIEGVTEKLQQPESNDPAWINSYYRIAPWRQAQNLLGEEEQRKIIAQQKIQQWLNENYPKDITFLTINGRNLEGRLDLREFVNLEKLDCPDNKLTSLDLSNCANLTHLYCNNNLFTDLDFLNPESEKDLPHPEKLKELYIGSNESLPEQNLSFLTPFVGLEELNIENCPFKGSLEYLKEMKELRRISISGTDIDSGLDDLPDSCRTIYCNFDYQSKNKSIEIIKEISKYSEEEGYNLCKWREDKQNSIASNVLPLERLFVIRSNIKKFLNKWGKVDEKKNLTELSNLQSPEQFNKFKYIGGIKWIARGAATGGGVLALTGYPEIGGGIAAVFPFVETVTSQIEERFYDIKEKQWEEFTKDTGEFLDNYHELIGLLESIKIGEYGEINKKLRDLKKRTQNFLKQYDKDSNGTVDISDLQENQNRNYLAQDLSLEKKAPEEGGSQLGDIAKAIRDLEREIINYRQGSSKGAEKTIDQLEEKKVDANEQLEESQQEKVTEKTHQYQALIEIPLD